MLANTGIASDKADTEMRGVEDRIVISSPQSKNLSEKSGFTRLSFKEISI